jgi:hypothetical protein
VYENGYDAHLYHTTFTPGLDMSLRNACARLLLRSPNGAYRSDAYWFIEHQHWYYIKHYSRGIYREFVPIHIRYPWMSV